MAYLPSFIRSFILRIRTLTINFPHYDLPASGTCILFYFGDTTNPGLYRSLPVTLNYFWICNHIYSRTHWLYTHPLTGLETRDYNLEWKRTRKLKNCIENSLLLAARPHEQGDDCGSPDRQQRRETSPDSFTIEFLPRVCRSRVCTEGLTSAPCHLPTAGMQTVHHHSTGHHAEFALLTFTSRLKE